MLAIDNNGSVRLGRKGEEYWITVGESGGDMDGTLKIMDTRGT